MENRTQRLLCATSILCVGAIGCGGDNAPSSSSASQALVAECVDENETLPAEAWECSEPRTIECVDGTGTADIGTVYVRDEANDDGCGDDDVTVSNSGPFAVGTHDIEVSGKSDAVYCKTTLTVVDSKAPTLEPHTLNLWPPNHKFHTISVNDCVSVTDACQGDLNAEFIWASSDEPVDDKGDGHHAPDIMISDCGEVQLRAERQGPKDGRVYKLGVRVVDGAGNATESECAIIVDHDQRGVLGEDSGEAYRIELNGQNATPACDGENPPPAPPPGDDDGDGGTPGGDDDGGDEPGDPPQTPPVDVI